MNFQKITLVFILAVYSILFVGCEERKTLGERSFQKERETQYAIQNFEEERMESHDNFNSLSYSIDTIFKDFDPANPQEPILAYEQVWINMVDKISRLDQRFESVQQHSEGLMILMDQITKQIGDEEKRENELLKNEITRRRFAKVLEETKTSLNRIHEAIDEGNDQFKILLLNGIRSSLNEEIVELKKITIDAKKILSELKNLSDEGTMILNITYEPEYVELKN